MNCSTPFLLLDKSFDQAIAELTEQLGAANLHVLRTFDLHNAGVAFNQCSCPHHGTGECDCHFAVLLVYTGQQPPVSLVAHGHDRKTWIALVDSPEQRPPLRSIEAIRQALMPV